MKADVEVKVPESLVFPLYPDKGPNFVTFELSDVSRGVLEYRPTKRSHTFNVVFTGLGALAGLAGSLVFIFSGNFLALAGVVAGLVFFAIGLRLTAIANFTRRFDSLRRIVTIPTDPEKYRSTYRSLPFDQVDYLQIVEKKLNGGEDKDYLCCEFNIVLRAGEARINIIQHPDKVALSNDVERIAKLIGCTFKMQGATLES